MNMNDLMRITDASKHYGITIAAILRADTEGWVKVLRINGDYYVVTDDLRKLMEFARGNPILATCGCIGGPCRCS